MYYICIDFTYQNRF